jgi:hypothetical protein
MAQYLINVPEDVRYEEVESALRSVSGRIVESQEYHEPMCVSDDAVGYRRTIRTKKISNEELYGDAMTLDESKQLLLEHIHHHFHHV